MHAPEAIKEYKEAQKDKSRLRSHTNRSNTLMNSSPISLSSNSPTHLEILDALVAAPTSDLAEARATFPTPEPGHLSPDSTFFVDVDLSPTSRINAVRVEAEVGRMEGRACQVLDGTWVHNVCQGVFCECKVVSVVHSGFKGVLAKSKRQCSMEEKGYSGIESRGKRIQD